MKVGGLKNHNFRTWGCSSNLIGSRLRCFWGCWETFNKYFFQCINSFVPLLASEGVFLASNCLHGVRGQKWSSPFYNTKNFEQIHWSKLVHRIYGLAVMLSISTSTTMSLINEILGKKRFRHIVIYQREKNLRCSQWKEMPQLWLMSV